VKLEFFDEPELEFAFGRTHLDVRHGLLGSGPLDRGTPSAPSEVRLAIVGTRQSVEELRTWLGRVKDGVPAKESRLGNLFPGFPGFSKESCFGSTVVVDDRWCTELRSHEIAGLLSLGAEGDLVDAAVELFLDAASSAIDQGGPAVAVIAPPADLLAALDMGSAGGRQDSADQEIDEGTDPDPKSSGARVPFHDLLKAKGMRLVTPIQMVRPKTYSGSAGTTKEKRKGKTAKRKGESQRLQDEATRAWNFHTALYYKAGGVLWRLIRDPAALTTCFIGISFFRSAEGDRLLTSVAQVFNERGDGVIVQGRPAQLDKDDRIPHLAEADATALLSQAITVYRREHRTSPARVVLHKTSGMNAAEVRGFREAAAAERIDVVDLLSVQRGLTRLFRNGVYPPLRGTFLETGPSSGLVYLRGSVNFFATYPGMYVPRPLEFRMESSESTPRQLGSEILGLSKLNWNNTQFDGGEPMTVRAARRVGDILKRMPEGLPIRPAYRNFM
jgi:hypothetical protein